MSDATNQPGSNDEPGDQGTNASVGNVGEPSGSADTRDVSAAEQEGPSPEQLDAQEEAFTGPRKPMGPTGEDDVPETTLQDPEES